jgi:peptidoglycan/LPS O-acetylase OafA/YrhL
MDPRRLQALRVALVALGSVSIALGPLMLLWPAGWRWEPHHVHYEQMMVGIYFTLGVFLLLAAREPLRHVSLIWFAVWLSIVHGSIMAVQALAGSPHRGHLLADVPALFIAAAVLGTLAPRRAASEPPVGSG